MRVEIFKGQGHVQNWYVRLVSGNNKVLNVSEGYFSKWNAKRAAKKTFPGVEIKYV